MAHPAHPLPPAGSFGTAPAGLTQQDREHLKTLSVLYYVYGGFQVLGVLALVLYMAFFGWLMVAAPSGRPPPTEVLIILGVAMLFSLVLLVATCALMFFAGKALSDHRNKVLCYIAAGVACLNMPLGTALGVFTFIVLARPSVSSAFDRS